MYKHPARYHESRCSHFITFSCYWREPLLDTPQKRETFEIELERVRKWYGFCVYAYVVMPEHVHLLVSEPERKTLAVVLQMLKQNSSHKLRPTGRPHVWLPRYYDLPIWNQEKHAEKLSYIHRNPVTRGLVACPDDWKWSSFHHYLTGEEGIVEIESEWTGRKRERAGNPLKLTIRRVEP